MKETEVTGLRHILVATDFSPRSDRAQRRAVVLARRFGARLTLFHAVDDDQPERLVAGTERAAAELIRELGRSLEVIEGVACQVRVARGEAASAILAASRELEADLLVVGPHRRQLLRDVFVGTTAERTIRSSRCPVLMANGPPAGDYRQVVAATDLSPCSAVALRAARDLGLTEGAATAVVHLFDAPWLSSRASLSKERLQDYLNDQYEQADRALADFLAEIGCKANARISRPSEGAEGREICALAEEIGADLIVVGTRGRGGIEKLLLGSVAADVLRLAACDVLAVPPDRAE